MKQKILNIIYKTLAFFAKIYLKRTKPQIIGITGSVGKTSCRMILYSTLSHFLTDRKIYTSPKNYNSEIGLVCSIFKIEDYKPSIFYILKLFTKIFFKSIFGRKNYDILILEYGIDKPKDMDFLLSIAKPYISIFTKLDFIHVANFKNQQELGDEKSKLLFLTKKIAFLNKKDSFQEEIFPKIEIEKYFYNEKKADFYYLNESGEIFSVLDYSGKKVQSNLLGEENIIYLELSLRILETFGYIFKNDFTKIKFDLQNGRFSIFDGIYNSKIIDSSYNSGPESMKSMILNSVNLKENIFNDYENIFVLGDMREIGESSKQKHKELFDFVLKFGEIISVGKETGGNFGKHLGNFKYSSDAGVFLKKYLEENKNKKYLILFKGSQNTIFLEEAIKEVLKNKSDEKFLVRQENYWKKRDF